MRQKKLLCAASICLMFAAFSIGCSNGQSSGQGNSQNNASDGQQTGQATAGDGQQTGQAAAGDGQQSAQNKFARIEMATGETIDIELYANEAPITVANFTKLAGQGFYDGLTFHRASAGLIIQGGDPMGNGQGGSDEAIKGEFLSNGVNNTLKHERGTVSMARTNDPNSASCQFFICVSAYPAWDGQYAAFGKVVSGIEAVDAMTQLPVTDVNSGAIIDKPVIKSIKILDSL